VVARGWFAGAYGFTLSQDAENEENRAVYLLTQAFLSVRRNLRSQKGEVQRAAGFRFHGGHEQAALPSAAKPRKDVS